MKKAITQQRAKVLIRDYLRETGRKGVTNLMRDIRRHTKTEIFEQRTFEKWLQVQERALQDRNWLLLLSFIESDEFKRFVPYANEGIKEKRLIEVADGLCALYSQKKRPDGVFLLPSQIEKQGAEAVQLLSGSWENIPNQRDKDIPRTICKIEAVPGKRYAKFAYIALFRSKQISTTGVVIYLYSKERAEHDYYHHFALQLWRRKDPLTGSVMPGDLSYLTLSKHQPEFLISNVVNQYFYRSEEEEAKDTISLRISRDIIPEENEIIDSLLTDVLPHGLT